MRALLTLLTICWIENAKSGLRSPEEPLFLKSLQFSNTHIVTSPYFQADTIPTIKKKGITLIQRSTKLYDVIFLAIPEDELPVETESVSKNPVPAAGSRTPLLKISGNILYDVNYRSRIDTPYAETNVYQHTVQTRLDLLYKNQYPLKVYFTSRFSNSSLFRNYTDFNIKFNPSDFKRIAKQKLMEAAQQWIAKRSANLDSLYRLIESKKTTIAALRQSLEKPDVQQKIVEDREKEFYRKKWQENSLSIDGVKAAVMDSVSAFVSGKLSDSTFQRRNKLKGRLDSLIGKKNNYIDSLVAKKQLIDSLQLQLEKLESQYRRIKSYNEKDIADLKKQIEEKDAGKLKEKLQQLNIPDTILPKGYKALLGIQLLNIGRSIADYSELSVKNISVTGVQAEYNTQYYYAVAVGKVDYRFRDYIVRNYNRSNQYVALVRFGKGTKNGNHIFLTYYTGRRQLYNASVALQDANRVPGYNLAGITIEGVYKINKHITVIGEIAKSTIPYYSLDNMQRKKWMYSIGKFNNRSNEAYALKAFSFFPKTLTRFSGNLSYTGANFQSFSTFTTGAAQLRWMARLEQPFFKKQLTIISTLQKNNYTNPFIATAYKSASLLTSVQANLQVKKYPTISLGYFPAYQLTKTGTDYYSQSRYYTLTGSAGHAYKIRQVQLSSYIGYSRFYNAASDSGFVYYNSKNLLLSQSFNFSRFSVLINGSLSTGNDYILRSMENTLQVTVNKIVSLGGGLKMIHYSLTPLLQWGYSGSLTLNIPKVGDIQLTADKGFIPGLNKQLAENKTGRVTFYKTF